MHSAIWSILGGGLSSFAALFSGILVARTMGSLEFGAFGIIQSTLAAYLVFVGPASGLTVTKYLAELRKHELLAAGELYGTVTALTAGFSFFLAIGMWLSSDYVASSIYRQPEVASGLRIASITLFTSALNSTQVGALAGLEEFRTIALLNASRSVLLIAASWIATLRFGLLGAVWAAALTSTAGCISGEIVVQRRFQRDGIRPSLQGIFKHTAVISRFLLPAMLTSAVALVSMWLAGVLLSRQSGGLEQFGLFTAANQWRTILLFIPTLVVAPFLPRLSMSLAAREEDGVRRVFCLSLLTTTVSVVGAALVAALFSERIVRTYGSTFVAAEDTLRTVLLATVLCGPSISIIQMLNALGRPWTVVMVHLLWAASLLAAQAFGSVTGAFGLAVAYAVAYGVQLVLLVWMAARIYRCPLRVK